MFKVGYVGFATSTGETGGHVACIFRHYHWRNRCGVPLNSSFVLMLCSFAFKISKPSSVSKVSQSIIYLASFLVEVIILSLE